MAQITISFTVDTPHARILTALYELLRRGMEDEVGIDDPSMATRLEEWPGFFADCIEAFVDGLYEQRLPRSWWEERDWQFLMDLHVADRKRFGRPPELKTE